MSIAGRAEMADHRLVLHICCAPDEAWVVQSLKGTRELHCFFCNPNIQPEVEYAKRLEEARGVAATYGVPFSADPYAPHTWESAVAGLTDTPEGGDRCTACFLLRLRRTAEFCRHLGWERFTTVMSISPHKRLAMLDAAGRQAADEQSVTYEQHNFKKKSGFLGSIRLSNELGLYRQDYCGCRLSRAERGRRNR